MPEHGPRGGTTNEVQSAPPVEINPANLNQTERTLPDIETAEEVVKVLRSYANTFGDPQLTYFPGPHTEVSPSFAFTKPNQHVVYVDIDPVPVKVLKEAGYNAVVADAHKVDFNPGEVDLLIIKNSVSADTPVTFVKKGGHVIAGWGWNDDVTPILERQKDLKLVGVYDKDNDKFITSDLDSYTKPTHKDELGRSHYEKTSFYYVFEKIEPVQESVEPLHDEHPAIDSVENNHEEDTEPGEHAEHEEKKVNIFVRAWNKLKNFFRHKRNDNENTEEAGH